MLPVLACRLPLALFAALSVAYPAAHPQTQVEAPTTPGITKRVFQLEGDFEFVPQLATEQTPNIDDLERELLWGSGDFGGLRAPIYCQAIGWLQVPIDGEYRFRLTSDDGSIFSLDGAAVVRNDGLHGSYSVVSRPIALSAGTHSLLVEHFDNGGRRNLRLEWDYPTKGKWTTLDATYLSTDADPARVTSPGPKKVTDNRKPGHGIALDGVHPGWTVETIETGEMVPKVGCMAFLPNGRLLFGTFEPVKRSNNAIPGRDERAPDGLYSYDPSTGEIKQVATELLEPTGLCVVDGDVYVAQRMAVVQLIDKDGDGVYEGHELIASGWEGWNYHQFTFGLVHIDGRLYTALSTSMGPPGWKGMESNSGPNGPMRGGILEIDLATQNVRVIAGGTRTPNGLGVGLDGSLLYLDNQGSWFPTSTLSEVIPGRFYGHYNWARFVPKLKERYPDGGFPSAFGDRMRTPPALFLPQNEVVNSPTQPVTMIGGPFDGQLLIGELTAGGIRRAALERVDGVLQGCLFRFSQGFQCGIQRMAWSPAGELYVGGIGAGGNWNWKGTTAGLQKLVRTGKAVFEMERVNATPDGFEISFTDAIQNEWLTNEQNFKISSWTYEPSQFYGGPKIDQREHAVLEAQPGAKGESVRLTVSGLETGRCYYLQLDPESAKGEPILSGDAWYTLHRIPGQNQYPHTGLGALPPGDAVPLIQSAHPPTMQKEGEEWPPSARIQSDFAKGPGYVTLGPGKHHLVTRTTHGDAHIHAEWYCPKGGEGNKRANSGLILQRRYEIQIYATTPTEEPSEISAGAIYGVSAPSVNASTGPDTWQSYDVFFRAPRFVDGTKTEDARIELLWNGVLVQQDVAIPGPTGKLKHLGEAPTAELLLQDFDSHSEEPVRFRNVWIRELPSESEPRRGGPWTEPFADKGNWAVRGGQATFTLVDGVLRGETRPNTPNTFFTSESQHADFELLYEARVHPELNSGVQIRSEVIGGFQNRTGALRGYQVEIDPSKRAWSGGLYEERDRAWLHPLHAAPYARRAFKQGEWNQFRVLAEGPRLRTWINGIPAADLFDAERPLGHFGFQVHGVGSRENPLSIEWRNVKLRTLSR